MIFIKISADPNSPVKRIARTQQILWERQAKASVAAYLSSRAINVHQAIEHSLGASQSAANILRQVPALRLWEQIEIINECTMSQIRKDIQRLSEEHILPGILPTLKDLSAHWDNLYRILESNKTYINDNEDDSNIQMEVQNVQPWARKLLHRFGENVSSSTKLVNGRPVIISTLKSMLTAANKWAGIISLIINLILPTPLQQSNSNTHDLVININNVQECEECKEMLNDLSSSMGSMFHEVEIHFHKDTSQD